MSDLVAKAQAIADDVLFPAAAEVDAKGEVPRSHFDLLAAEGFYGLAAPVELGGAGAGLPELVGALEALAGGCLSTMFTWMQHHGLVAGLLGSPNETLRSRYLAALIRGDLRAGVAFAGVIPEPPRMRATRVDGGYVFVGKAPFVSGWGSIDLLQLSGRDGETVVNTIVEPVAGPRLSVHELELVAAQGTATVELTLDGYFVPEDRVFSETTHAAFVAGHLFGSRMSGCAALGLAERAARLIEEAGKPDVAAALRPEQAEIRIALDAALGDPASLPKARAAGSELAFRSAGALVAAVGSSAVLAGQHAQRLVREATFLLVAAGRPEIKSALLEIACRR
jgi:alkylation response protein AidB-like acyl-CoA dehydrogenase